MNYNKLIVAGHATNDARRTETSGKLPVASWGMAVNYRRKDKDDEVCFVDVTIFGRQAETAGEWIKKGTPLLVEGRLVYDTWEKDGQKRSRHRMVAQSFHFGPKAAAKDADSNFVPPKYSHGTRQADPVPTGYEIPF